MLPARPNLLTRIPLHTRDPFAFIVSSSFRHAVFFTKRVYTALYKHILNYMRKRGFRQVFCT